LLAPGGTITIEFPHVQRLIEGNQFDTIYHEHFSYFSLTTTTRLLHDHGLRVLDVEELWTHGGSLRVHAVHDDDPRPPSERVAAVLAGEREAGLDTVSGYLAFQPRVEATKRNLLSFLIDARERGRSVAGYG